MQKINVLELMPIDGRKSFYGKAKVYVKGGMRVLKSYDTEVCAIDPAGNVLRYWGGYSATTMRHINAFLKTFGVPGGGKAWWDSLPVLRFSWVDFYAA